MLINHDFDIAFSVELNLNPPASLSDIRGHSCKYPFPFELRWRSKSKPAVKKKEKGEKLNIRKKEKEKEIQKTSLQRVSPPSSASLTQTVIKSIVGLRKTMFEPQHFMDLHDNSSLGDPKSWLSGDDNSSPIHRRTQSSLSSASAAGTAANVDRLLFNDLVEIVPLVQSLIVSSFSALFF